RDEVHVLEPRQVVFGRPRRPLETLRDFGQRQALFLAEDLENRLERAVAAGAMQPQLVREVTELREAAFRVHQRGERPEGIAGGRAAAALLAHRRQLLS